MSIHPCLPQAEAEGGMGKSAQVATLNQNFLHVNIRFPPQYLKNLFMPDTLTLLSNTSFVPII